MLGNYKQGNSLSVLGTTPNARRTHSAFIPPEAVNVIDSKQTFCSEQTQTPILSRATSAFGDCPE